MQWAVGVDRATTSGKKPALLPNLGGSLPNDIFTDVLGLPTRVGAALLSGLLAARAQRAPAGRSCCARRSA